MRDFSKLPIIVVDDDFFEYVAEMGHSDEVTYEDYVLLCHEWLADNTWADDVVMGTGNNWSYRHLLCRS